jgi:hypothetical protein
MPRLRYISIYDTCHVGPLRACDAARPHVTASSDGGQ